MIFSRNLKIILSSVALSGAFRLAAAPLDGIRSDGEAWLWPVIAGAAFLASFFAGGAFYFCKYRAAIRRNRALRQAMPVRTVVYTRDGSILLFQKEHGIELNHTHLSEVGYLRESAVEIMKTVHEVFDTGQTLQREYELGAEYRSVTYSLQPANVFGQPAVLAVSVDSTQLRHRIAAAELMNQSLTGLTLAKSFQEAIDGMLRRFGEFADVDRCFIYRLDQLSALREFVWSREGVPPAADVYDLMAEPNVITLLRQGKPVNITDLDAPQRELAGVQFCRKGDPIRSLLMVDIQINGVLFGLIGFSMLTRERRFTENDAATLREAAQLYVLARERHCQTDKLAAETALHAQIFEKVNVPLAMFNRDRKLVAINHSCLHLIGHADNDAMPGMRCDERLCLTADRSHCTALRCPIRYTLTTGDPGHTDMEWNGRTLHFKTQPILDGDGSVQYVLESIYDLTEERAQQQALSDANALLTDYIMQDKTVNRCMEMMALEQNPDTVFQSLCATIGAQLQLPYCVVFQYHENPARLTQRYLWQNHPDAPRFFDWSETYQEDSPQIFGALKEQGMIHLRLGEKPEGAMPQWQHEIAMQLRTHGVNEVIAVAIYSRNKFWGYLGTGVNSTAKPLGSAAERMFFAAARIAEVLLEREEGQRALRQSELEKQTVLNMLQIPVFLFDTQGNILHANPAARQLSPMALPPPEVHSEQLAPQSSEHQIGDRTYRIDTLPIGENGAVTRVLQSYVDLTEINRSKELLREAAEKAENAARTQSLFLATMSHEIRTPLNAVIGFSELLQGNDVPADRQKDYLKSINYAGNALLHLINDILDLSKIDADQMEMHQEPTQVDILLEQLMAIFRHSAEEKSLVLTFQRDLSFPLLRLDPQRLRQILLNIVGNAIKFTERGGVSLQATFRETAHGSGMLSIVVKDTGPGISQANRERIFEPFVQDESVRGKRAESGTGLGLAIARRLVERMGGVIELASEPGRGSTFSIELPQVEICHEPPAPGMALALGTPEELPSRLRVLVVDDVELNVQVLAAILHKLHLRCETATSGAAALDTLLTRRPDVILTDLWMPGMNGAELARKIRENPAFDDIRIIAVTADTESENNFDVQFFDTVLLKPVSLEMMQKCLRELPRGRRN